MRNYCSEETLCGLIRKDPRTDVMVADEKSFRKCGLHLRYGASEEK